MGPGSFIFAGERKVNFDGVRRAGFIRKVMKNYSLETETEWQLWMVE